MADESSSWVSVDESTTAASAAPNGSTTRLRKKRKWDQPAEILVSAGISVPGIHPMTNVGQGPVVGVPLPGVANAAIQKLIQPNIQDELIAREIVINEAESTIRYKLTKRQTQEEIQRCTGAVVITRGKYRPPGALPDGEKPLYLHISAGAPLKEVAERIIAVDRAAIMVEEMLKSGHNSQSVSSSFQATANNVVKALSTCVYLGFDADPSANIAARIRGPNDQYINHIMNETGAAVILRGRGAENVENLHAEENQQPLHLYLSSNSPKSLEDAKRLAENLLDTISVEFGATRASSLKLYNAVPPQQHLLAGFQSSGHAVEVIPGPNACLTSSAVGSSPVPPLLPIPRVAPLAPSVGTFVTGQSLAHYLPPLSSGTSYNGYGGIYPQATPLQQVALALRQSTSPTPPNVSSEISIVSTIPQSSDTSASEKEKGRPNRRKFQELPAAKVHTKQHEVSEFGNLSKPFMAPVVKNVSTLLTPNKSVHSSSSVMPPPPPRTMPPPPPPPKFTSSVDSSKNPERKNIKASSKSDIIPDTLIKLTEYGGDDDDDDDIEDTTEKISNSNLAAATTSKPFWAL